MKSIRALIFSLLGLVLAISGCSSPAPESTPDPALIEAVEQGLLPHFYFEDQQDSVPLLERMRHYNVPGISVAVIEGGEVAWAKGYGIGAGPDGQAPIDAQTLFQAASISKPIAVTAVMRLAEDGTLDLDEDVNNRLTSWKVPANEWTSHAPVTLRTLMSHTAGLTVHGFPGYRPDQPLPEVPQILDGQEPANTAAVRVDKLPGEGFRYSGGGTTVMQQLAIDVSGLPFPQFMSQQVLDPLGMSRSTYQQPLSGEWTSNASRAHDEKGEVVEGGWHVYPEMAAAGLWTTAGDLARAAVEMQRSLKGESNKILKQATAKEMLTEQNGGPVGLGFFLEGEGESRRFGHGGSNRGFRCRLVAYLERGQGAAVMTNASQGGALIQEVLEAIARVYEWPDFPHSAVQLVRLDSDQLDRYAGIFEVPSIGRFEVTRQGDDLLGSRSGSDQTDKLLPVSETEFILESQRSRIVFELQDGRAEAFTTRIRGEEVRAQRVRE